MRPSRILLLSATLLAATTGATSAAGAGSQHSLSNRSLRTHLGARSPLFGVGGDDSSTDSRSATNSAAAASSSSSAQAASSSAAAVSASRAASISSSIASAAAASAAASFSAAASSSLAAASSSAAAASRSSASAAMLTTSSGLTTTLTSVVEATQSSSAATASATSADSSSSSGPSTGLIIGVSVAGGVLLLALFAFLYFKFGTKRFSDYDDGDADIKWPELKHDPDSNVMQPLPARRTGGAGFDMGNESDGEGNEHEGMAGGVEKVGRASFTGSTTALNTAPPAGYAVNDYPPGVEHTYGMDHAAGQYYHQDQHNMYHGYDQQGYDQQYPMSQGGYQESNPYGADPYTHSGMAHPSHAQYQQQHGYS